MKDNDTLANKKNRCMNGGVEERKGTEDILGEFTDSTNGFCDHRRKRNENRVYSGNHHTWNNNFFVLLLISLEFISMIKSSIANLTT